MSASSRVRTPLESEKRAAIKALAAVNPAAAAWYALAEGGGRDCSGVVRMIEEAEEGADREDDAHLMEFTRLINLMAVKSR